MSGWPGPARWTRVGPRAPGSVLGSWRGARASSQFGRAGSGRPVLPAASQWPGRDVKGVPPAGLAAGMRTGVASTSTRPFLSARPFWWPGAGGWFRALARPAGALARLSRPQISCRLTAALDPDTLSLRPCSVPSAFLCSVGLRPLPFRKHTQPQPNQAAGRGPHSTRRSQAVKPLHSQAVHPQCTRSAPVARRTPTLATPSRPPSGEPSTESPWAAAPSPATPWWWRTCPQPRPSASCR